ALGIGSGFQYLCCDWLCLITRRVRHEWNSDHYLLQPSTASRRDSGGCDVSSCNHAHAASAHDESLRLYWLVPAGHFHRHRQSSAASGGHRDCGRHAAWPNHAALSGASPEGGVPGSQEMKRHNSGGAIEMKTRASFLIAIVWAALMQSYATTSAVPQPESP